jgi:hypothetical protein
MKSFKLSPPENQATLVAGILSLVGVFLGVAPERWSQDRMLHQVNQMRVPVRTRPSPGPGRCILLA